MPRPGLAAAAVAAVLATVLPFARLLPVPPAAGTGVAVATGLLAAAVVVGAGWDGHRRAVRALGRATVSADVGISLAVLAAAAWSVPPLLVGAGPPGDPAALLHGPALLPGAAAVLTVAARAVRRTGRAADDPDDPGGTSVVADRWSARIVPAAALLALGVAGFRGGTGEAWTTAVPAGLTVLLACCPVALAAAVPAAVRAADRAGGPHVRLPLPVRDGAHGWTDPVGWTGPGRGPQHADLVDTVALAGPEVLTGAVPGALVAHPARDADPATVLRMARSVTAAVAAGSDLAPVATALAAVAPDPVPDVAEPDERAGLGVSGLVAELVPGPGPAGAPGPTVVAHAVLLGSPGWLLEHGIVLPAEVSAARERIEDDARAAVALAWDGTARAVLSLARVPAPGAAAGVAALRALGPAPVLLTPDGAAAAGALATAAGLDPSDPDAVRSGLDAAGRAAAVAGLRVRGRTVAVAADPATDPAALARADLPVELHPRHPLPDDADPVAAPTAGSARIVVRGGPAEVAAAIGLARGALAHARSGTLLALVVVAAGALAGTALGPAPPLAALPVLGALAVRARGLPGADRASRSVRNPGYLRVG